MRNCWFPAEFYSILIFLMRDLDTERCFDLWESVCFGCWQFILWSIIWNLTLSCHCCCGDKQSSSSSVTGCRSLALARCPVLTLWLQGFGAFLWCCQQRYQRCWACGCCKDWSTFPLIYLVTPPSSGGVYELTGEKKQPICKQQNNKPVLQFLLLMFGFFYLLVMSFLVHLQFQVLRYVMMLLIFTWVWILY